MPAGHVHGQHDGRASPRVRRLLLVAVAPIVLATLGGLVLLWPREAPELEPAVGFPTGLVRGSVKSSGPAPCPGSEPGSELAEAEPVSCKSIEVLLLDGPDEGDTVTLDLVDDRETRPVEAGDVVVLGRTAEAPPGEEYYLADYERRFPLALLAAVFAAVVVALGRWRGVFALAGFGITLGVLVVFVLPAILAGGNPLAVAVVGSSAVMLVALYLAHGVNVRTTTAVLGTSASLILTGLLSLLFVGASKLTGFTSEEAIFVSATASQVNLRGLLLGGIIIGALGVLDDVTITQASAVWELHRANPAYSARELYRSALRIGRDHIASTVNTLLLAYAGASLPLLILFTLADTRVGHVLNGEIVAEEVVRTLVGSIGLVAAVPITTGLAALVVARDRRRVLPARPARRPPQPRPRSEEELFWEEA